MIAIDNYCCSLYIDQQTGPNPFPYPVTSSSGSVPLATNSRHNHPGQLHSGMSKHDSRLPISAESAYNKRVEYIPRTSVPDLWDVGNSNSGHVCHSPQHASSPVHVSSSGALSTGDICLVTGLAGEVDIHVSTVSPAQQSHSEAQDHSDRRGDTHHPLVAVTTMVSTSAMSVCGPPSLLSISPGPTVTTGICLRRQIIPSANMKALMQHYQAAGFSKEVSRLVAAPGRPSTNRMYDNSGFALLTGPQDKKLIRLVPQLLK